MNNKTYDVIVCGGGPAGVCAAIAAARKGCEVLIIEQQNCLGGIWTSGLMPVIHDIHNKNGLIKEFADLMIATNSGRYTERGYFLGEPEAIKFLLEKMCLKENIHIQYYTFLESVIKKDNMIKSVVGISKAGREEFFGRLFIDATGDGDLGYHSGCSYEIGMQGSGRTQPMSLIAMICGVPYDEITELDNGLIYQHGKTPKQKLLEAIKKTGYTPSYGDPALFYIQNDTYILMANHEYGYQGNSAEDLTQATIHAREEINHLIDSLRSLGGLWQNIELVQTSAYIGVRECRRIKGLYEITRDDLVSGRRHSDCICKARFGMDIHSINKEESTSYSHSGGVKEYDIPLRALISRDVDNLMMAGRCISGDFYAHSSYRVTGNATVIGEAAGAAAAYSVKNGILPKEIDFENLEEIF